MSDVAESSWDTLISTSTIIIPDLLVSHKSLRFVHTELQIYS